MQVEFGIFIVAIPIEMSMLSVFCNIIMLGKLFIHEFSEGTWIDLNNSDIVNLMTWNFDNFSVSTDGVDGFELLFNEAFTSNNCLKKV